MSLSYPTGAGDIDHLIADDHAIVERQFQHLEARRGDRAVLVKQISVELVVHAFAEETVLYPHWLDVGMIDENTDARAEHQQLKQLLVVLDKGRPDEADFERALTELIAVTRHHVLDEETRELPAFRAQVGPEQMAELGQAFLAAKRKAPTKAHPSVPDSGGVAKLVGALAKPIDKLRSVSDADQLATDASGLLVPQAQAIVDALSSLKPLPIETLTPAQARKQPGPDAAVKRLLTDLGRSTDPEPVGSVEDLDIADAVGGVQSLRIYRPIGVQPGAPIIVWIHGGGWVLFDTDTYDASCRGLCNKTGAIVVSPNYRRAPEAVFPASHDDVLTAYRWTVRNAAALGGSASRIGIGGESVGGNMAPATVLQLMAAGEALPLAQVCVYPVTTGEQFGASMDDAADARPLSRALLSWMAMHAFAGQPTAGQDPRIDLLGLSPALLAQMPPTLVITAERDVLRSQGEQFAQLLQAAGAQVTAIRYDGVMHEFFGASAVLTEAEAAQREAADHFLRAFGAPDPYPAESPTARVKQPER